LFTQAEVAEMVERHSEAPHMRELQKVLAKDITIRVHTEADYEASIEASQILFGKGTTETLRKLDERTFLSVFEGVPQFELNKADIENGIGVVDFLAEKTQVFASKGEARRMLKDNGVSINKSKVKDDYNVGLNDLLNEKYILVQKGKKNYHHCRTIYFELMKSCEQDNRNNRCLFSSREGSCKMRRSLFCKKYTSYVNPFKLFILKPIL